MDYDEDSYITFQQELSHVDHEEKEIDTKLAVVLQTERRFDTKKIEDGSKGRTYCVSHHSEVMAKVNPNMKFDKRPLERDTENVKHQMLNTVYSSKEIIPRVQCGKIEGKI